MSDNTVLLPGGGGDTLRDVDKGGIKTQVTLIDVGGLGTESLWDGTIALPTGASTGAKQDSGNTSLASIDGKITAVNTGAVVVSSSALPSGAATALRQDTGNTSVASIDTKTPSLGQALAAGSVPIVLTAIQQAALTPPAAITGYALESGHLAAIDTATANIPAQGQALAAGSMPVVLTAAQISTLTPPAALTNYALETGGNLATVVSAIKAEDSVSTDQDKGFVNLAVRQDLPITDTSTAGDYSFIKTDSKGRVWVTSDLLDAVLRSHTDALSAILTEMRVQTYLLQAGLNVRDDLDGLRQDPYFNASLQ